jgi:AbrB family looped-hinge helix DNA binding protein
MVTHITIMEKKMKIGPKGRAVIPKDIRDITGIKSNTGVIVSLNGNNITIRTAKPLTESYLKYYKTTYSKKLKNSVDINIVLDDEYGRNFLH